MVQVTASAIVRGIVRTVVSQVVCGKASDVVCGVVPKTISGVARWANWASIAVTVCRANAGALARISGSARGSALALQEDCLQAQCWTSGRPAAATGGSVQGQEKNVTDIIALAWPFKKRVQRLVGSARPSLRQPDG